MLSFQNVAFCQSSENDYIIFEDYNTDSLEYYRIKAKDDSSWGFINKAGEIVIPLGKYEYLNPIDQQGMILARKDGKEGYIDITGKILIPFIYDNVGVFSDSVGLASITKKGKQGFINYKGDIIIPLEYDEISYLSYFHDSGVAILAKNGRYGVIGPRNNMIIPFKYNKIEYLNNQDCFVVTKGKKWATFSFDGKQLSKFDNYIIIPNRQNLFPNQKKCPLLITTEKNEKDLANLLMNTDYTNGTKRFRDSIEASLGGEFAYIDKSKQIIIPFGMYDYAEPFGLGQNAIVAQKGAYGIINEHGKVVLPLNYDFLERFSNYVPFMDIFLATKGQIVTVFDSSIKKVPVEGIVSYLHWNNNIFISNIHGKKGILDYAGIQTIPFEYDTLYFSYCTPIEGFIAKKNNMYGFITKENDIIKPFEYKNIYELKDQLVFINTDGKAGMYNEKGEIKLPFEYDAIYDTYYTNFEPEESKYIVIKNGKVGTVDIHNKVVIPIIYDGLSGWVEYGPEAHFAKKNGKFGLISYEGQVIIPLEYEYVDLPASGIIVVRKNGKYGAISLANKEILPCIYDKIFDDIPVEYDGNRQKPKLVVLQNDAWSYYDIKGKVIRKNIPKSEIIKKYGYRLEWGGPSNEHTDFDLKQVRL